MPGVLGLDLAPVLCGWAAGDGSSVPDAGAWVLPETGRDLGALALAYSDCLTWAIDFYRPELVVYEEPILTRFDKPLTLRKTYGLGLLTEAIVARRHRRGENIRYLEADLRRVKSAMTGDHHASKADMVRAAMRLGVVLPKAKDEGREDAADAVGVWKWGLTEIAPAAASAWDAILFEGRGGLL